MLTIFTVHIHCTVQYIFPQRLQAGMHLHEFLPIEKLEVGSTLTVTIGKSLRLTAFVLYLQL